MSFLAGAGAVTDAVTDAWTDVSLSENAIKGFMIELSSHLYQSVFEEISKWRANPVHEAASYAGRRAALDRVSELAGLKYLAYRKPLDEASLGLPVVESLASDFKSAATLFFRLIAFVAVLTEEVKKDLAKFNQSGVLSGFIFSVTSMVSPLGVHNSGVLGGLIEKMRQSFEEFSKTASSNQPKLIEILRQELSAEALAHSLRDLLVALEESDIEKFLVLKLNLCKDFLPVEVGAAVEAIATAETAETVGTTVDVAEVVAVSAQALEDAKGVDSAASSTSYLVMDETVVGSREAFNDEELPTDTRVSEAVESSSMGAGSALANREDSRAFRAASTVLASASKPKTDNSLVFGSRLRAPVPQKGQTPTPAKQARKSAKESKKSEPVDDGSYAICNGRRRAHKHGSEMSYKKYTSGLTNQP